jgi:hypothetical protein
MYIMVRTPYAMYVNDALSSDGKTQFRLSKRLLAVSRRYLPNESCDELLQVTTMRRSDIVADSLADG